MSENVDLVWIEYHASHSVALRDRLVEAYLPFSNSIAARMKRPLSDSIDLNDMKQDAAIGLCHAVERFDPRKGVKFSTYAHHHIWGHVIDGLRQRNWFGLRTMKTPRGENTEHIFSSITDDHDDLAKVDARLSAAALIESLPIRDRPVMRMYFVDGLLMKDAGRLLGVGQPSISQRIKRSLTTLKRIVCMGETMRRIAVHATFAILVLCATVNGSMLRIWDTRVGYDWQLSYPAGDAVVRQSLVIPVTSELNSIDLGVWPASADPMIIAWELRRDGTTLASDVTTVDDLPLVHPFVIRFDFPVVSLSLGDRLTLTEYSPDSNSRAWMSERMGLISAGYGSYQAVPEAPLVVACLVGATFLLSRRRR